MMNIYSTEFKDVLLLEPQKFDDERGYFMETFNHEFYNKIIPGFLTNFVQDNESKSKRGVFRGFHYQKWPMHQSKLVRVVKGKIIDIVICLVKNSPNYGRFIAFELSDENRRQLFIPKGYAHGFIALEDDTIVNYKVDQFWSKSHEVCINYNCIDYSKLEGLDINVEDFTISEKDKLGIDIGNLAEGDWFYDMDLKTENEDAENNENLPESTNIIEVE